MAFAESFRSSRIYRFMRALRGSLKPSQRKFHSVCSESCRKPFTMRPSTVVSATSKHHSLVERVKSSCPSTIRGLVLTLRAEAADTVSVLPA